MSLQLSLCVPSFLCLFSAFSVSLQLSLFVPSFLCVFPDFSVCPQLSLCLPSFLCLFSAFSVSLQLSLFVPSFLCLSPAFFVSPQLSLFVSSFLCFSPAFSVSLQLSLFLPNFLCFSPAFFLFPFSFLYVSCYVRTFSAPPETSVFPASVRANVGCQVTFRCLDGENPPSGGSFQWFRNGAELATSGNLAVMADGRLVLSDVSPQDSGNFSCTIRGSGGEAVATASLTVAMIITSLARNVSITTLTPPTQALAVHQVVQFVCLVEGNPPPQVRWLRNGNPVPNFNRVANLNESLRIRDLRQTDSGTYSCVANNSLGQDSREFQLLVGGKWWVGVAVGGWADVAVGRAGVAVGWVCVAVGWDGT